MNKNMARFVSKSGNLLVVLQAGLSAQPLTGTPAKPTVSVRFKDGIALVPDGDMSDMMMSHPGYNSDFILAEMENDPYSLTRQSSEPTHIMTEMKYGTPTNRKIAEARQPLPVEMAKMVTDMAAEMAKSMLPSMIESALKDIVKDRVPTPGKVVIKKKGKPGRKPKAKNEVEEEEVIKEETIPQDPRLEDSMS